MDPNGIIRDNLYRDDTKQDVSKSELVNNNERWPVELSVNPPITENWADTIAA